MTSLGRSTRLMAMGTIASRGTGFVRTAVIAAALGVGSVSAAYNVANTTPNIVYELMLGGVLGSIVVPLLVRATKDDADGGTAYTQRLLTLTVLVLGGAALVLVLFAPVLIDLYAGRLSSDARELAVVFARFFLPQLLFYGIGAVLGAALNARGSFAAPMFAPVVNNLVVILTGLAFLAVRGAQELTPGGLSDNQILLLGLGTTLGIVAQTVALIPAVRAVGIPLRPRFDLRGTGLRKAGGLAKWILLYVAANQVAYLVVVRLSSDEQLVASGRGYPSYVFAFVLWQLPHAIIGVSIITALLPRMSRAAADDRLGDLRRSLNRGLRLTASVLVPASVAFIVLGRDLAVVVFAHGNISVANAQYIGVLLGVFAVGLVPFSLYQLQLRAFYALQDTRTPTLINLGVNATLIVTSLVLYAVLPPDLRVIGLAAGSSCSFAVGLLICSRVLSRRLGGLDGRTVVRTVVRCLIAVAVPALAAGLLAGVITGAVGEGPGGAALALAAGGTVLAAGYVLLARRLRIREVDDVVGPVLRRIGLH